MDKQSVDTVQRMDVVIQKCRSKCIAHMAVHNYSSNKLELRNGRNEAIELKIMEILLISMISSFLFAIERIASRGRSRTKDVDIRWARSNRIAIRAPN